MRDDLAVCYFDTDYFETADGEYDEALANAFIEDFTANLVAAGFAETEGKEALNNNATQYTKDAFDSLEKEFPGNYIHRIELLPGMGHGINYSLTTPWLKQYTRNPYPKSVNWENFEMDGRYRDGFYNLYVLERSNDDTRSRTYYQMNIEGNHIDLKVDLVTYKTVKTDPQWGIELKFERFGDFLWLRYSHR